MPRYFIDTSDQSTFCRDGEGRDYDSLEEAKAMAVKTLPDMARDELPDGDARTFLAIVRDANGRAVLQAGLSLHVTSLIPNDERSSGLGKSVVFAIGTEKT